MKKQHSRRRAASVTLLLALLLAGGQAHAATSPGLGFADTFGILAGTYTNTLPGTTIAGDLGYTTGPAVTPTVSGATHQADGIYNQAGIDQGVALANLNSQLCTHTFAPGAVDLASNLDFPTATYTPGVYCATGAITITAPGITLNGSGVYIFKTTGSLNSAANTEITLAGSASECDVWWSAVGAATLGANSIFKGTIIDDAGITVGSTVDWEGRALAFGGTVTTNIDTLSVPSCAAQPSASLTVTKTVVNDDGGILSVSDFPLFVSGQPITSGVATTTLAPGAYTVTETGDAGYTAGSWGGDCATDGSITLSNGDIAVCTITNDDIEPVVSVASSGGGWSSRPRRTEPVASSTDLVVVATTSAAVASTTVSGSVIGSVVPGLPNAGFGPDTVPYTAAPIGFLGSVVTVWILRRKTALAAVNAL